MTNNKQHPLLSIAYELSQKLDDNCADDNTDFKSMPILAKVQLLLACEFAWSVVDKLECWGELATRMEVANANHEAYWKVVGVYYGIIHGKTSIDEVVCDHDLCGDLTFKADGLTITVFIDGGDFDYTDRVVLKDGREFEFDDLEFPDGELIPEDLDKLFGKIKDKMK